MTLIKRLCSLATAAVMAATVAINASAADSDIVPPREYEFAAPDYTFGKSTSTDFPIAKDKELLNIRRNKDTALAPPPYGVFGGVIPTDQLSLYHTAQYEEEAFSKWAGGISTTADTGVQNVSNAGGFLPPTSVSTSQKSVSYNSSATSKSTKTTAITEPTYNEDGSIGKLTVPHLNKSIKVYDDTTVENMRKGLGHFKYTSAWDGNVGLAGHNRGNYAFFSFLKDLKKSDTLKYTTANGTKSYTVTGIYKISVDDTSYLGWTNTNQLTMITCIANEPLYRLCVVASEVT